MTKDIQEWFLMPSIKECLAEYEKQELGLISDIAKHGCAGGVSGLIYYSETSSFYDQHEGEIWQVLKDTADAAGIKNGLQLYNICKDPSSLELLKNDLVWFAVEVLAQELDDAAREEKLAVFDKEVEACS